MRSALQQTQLSVDAGRGDSFSIVDDPDDHAVGFLTGANGQRAGLVLAAGTADIRSFKTLVEAVAGVWINGSASDSMMMVLSASVCSPSTMSWTSLRAYGRCRAPGAESAETQTRRPSSSKLASSSSSLESSSSLCVSACAAPVPRGRLSARACHLLGRTQSARQPS